MMNWVTKYSAGENEQKTGRPGQLPYRPVWFSHGYAPERCVARDLAFLQRAIQPDGADVHRIV